MNAIATTTRPAILEQLLPGLHATTPEPLPFAPSLEVRAFVLERPAGNVLTYTVPGLAAHAGAIASIGGISRRYLNHAHEAMFLSATFGAPLFVHEADRAAVERQTPVRGTFSRRHKLDDDLEVIPTPGHTPGATSYLWDSGERRLLFTGDTIYLDEGEWTAAVLGSSDRASYARSLELIRDLEFDAIVPWAASAGDRPIALTDRDDTRERIDALIAGVRDRG